MSSQTNSAPFPRGSRLAAYLRDSGGDAQELSTLQQEAQIRAWAAEHGYIIHAAYIDAARTGSTTANRDQFHAMLAEFRAEGCPMAGVVVWSFSRFARDIDDSQFYRAELRRAGYDLYSITDPVPSGLDGRFFEAAVDWMNQRFLDDLSRSVKRGQDYIIENHHAWISGNLPRGYRRIQVQIGERRNGQPHIISRLEPDPITAPIVRKAFEMRADGATYREIHAVTNIYSQIPAYQRMFASTIYIGILTRYNGSVIADFCEPITTPEIWQRCQSRQTFHSREMRSRYLLSGIAYCAMCGSKLVGKWSRSGNGTRRLYYYQCSRRSYLDQPCGARLIPKVQIENTVIDSLRQFCLIPKVQQDIYAEAARQAQAGNAPLDADLSRLRLVLGDTEKRINRIVTAIGDLGHSTALLSQLAQLEHDRDETKRRMRELEHTKAARHVKPYTPDDIAGIVDAARERLGTNDDQTRAVMRAFISRVEASRRPDDTLDIHIVYRNPWE